MNYQKMNFLTWNNYQKIYLIFSFLTFFVNEITCVPILKGVSESNQELKDEKHYPNGTVIGKYAYVDSEGNPVQVKYFADDSSYGVELKSIKVVDSSSGAPGIQSIHPNMMGNVLEPLKVASDVLKLKYNVIGNEDSVPYEYLNNEIGKIKTFKEDKAKPDYEIFYQKELRAPKKCYKDNVKVYFDKEKRRTRNGIKKRGACNYNKM